MKQTILVKKPNIAQTTMENVANDILEPVVISENFPFRAFIPIAQQTWASEESTGSSNEFTLDEILDDEIIETQEIDPLLALAGTLEWDVTDIGERHDDYIGDTLLIETRADGDE